MGLLHWSMLLSARTVCMHISWSHFFVVFCRSCIFLHLVTHTDISTSFSLLSQMRLFLADAFHDISKISLPVLGQARMMIQLLLHYLLLRLLVFWNIGATLDGRLHCGRVLNQMLMLSVRGGWRGALLLGVVSWAATVAGTIVFSDILLLLLLLNATFAGWMDEWVVGGGAVFGELGRWML